MRLVRLSSWSGGVERRVARGRSGAERSGAERSGGSVDLGCCHRGMLRVGIYSAQGLRLDNGFSQGN